MDNVWDPGPRVETLTVAAPFTRATVATVDAPSRIEIEPVGNGSLVLETSNEILVPSQTGLAGLGLIVKTGSTWANVVLEIESILSKSTNE